MHNVPIEDSLDLHPFQPRDIPSVVEEYVIAAHEAGFREVRLIHGRGKGVQRGIVQAALEKHPLVVSFDDAPESHLGATVAVLELSRGLTLRAFAGSRVSRSPSPESRSRQNIPGHTLHRTRCWYARYRSSRASVCSSHTARVSSASVGRNSEAMFQAEGVASKERDVGDQIAQIDRMPHEPVQPADDTTPRLAGIRPKLRPSDIFPRDDDRSPTAETITVNGSEASAADCRRLQRAAGPGPRAGQQARAVLRSTATAVRA